MMRCKTHLTSLSPRYGVINMKKPLEKLKNIAEELNVPYAPYEYVGEADEYAVYAVTGIGGDNYANNRAQAHIAQVELDYIQPIQKSYGSSTESRPRRVCLMPCRKRRMH